MKVCKSHWDIMIEAVKNNGLWELVAKDGEEATRNAVRELSGDDTTLFDPLMSMNWHWFNSALKEGGLYLMGSPEDGSNDGHYCPLCEYDKHTDDFDAAEDCDGIAKSMRVYCIQKGLIRVN